MNGLWLPSSPTQKIVPSAAEPSRNRLFLESYSRPSGNSPLRSTRIRSGSSISTSPFLINPSMLAAGNTRLAAPAMSWESENKSSPDCHATTATTAASTTMPRSPAPGSGRRRQCPHRALFPPGWRKSRYRPGPCKPALPYRRPPGTRRALRKRGRHVVRKSLVFSEHRGLTEQIDLVDHAGPRIGHIGVALPIHRDIIGQLLIAGCELRQVGEKQALHCRQIVSRKRGRSSLRAWRQKATYRRRDRC